MKAIREFLGSILPFMKDKNKTIFLVGLMAALYYVDTATWNKPDSPFHLSEAAWKIVDCTGLSLVFVGKWLFPTGKMERFHKLSFYIVNGFLTLSAWISIWTPVASPEFIIYTSGILNGVMEGYNYFAKLSGLDPVPLPVAPSSGDSVKAMDQSA